MRIEVAVRNQRHFTVNVGIDVKMEKITLLFGPVVLVAAWISTGKVIKV